MKAFVIFVLTFVHVVASKGVSKTSKHYKDYYKFEDKVSVLSLNVTMNLNSPPLQVNFLDEDRSTITYFHWKDNKISVFSCKTKDIPTTSPLYCDPTATNRSIGRYYDGSMRFFEYNYEYNDITARITLYKAHERFLVIVNNETLINLDGVCGNVLGQKASFISFGDDLVQSFEIQTVKCGPGYHVSEMLTCSKCPVNTYGTDGECKKCPSVSKSHEGSTSFNDCALERCKAGYYLDANLNCTICPNGTYSSEGQVWCPPCPVEKTSFQGSTRIQDCKACPPGYSSRNSTCKPCQNGTYTDRKKGDGCHPCPLGQTSDQAASSYQQCYFKCKPGEINSGDKCVKCPENTYSSGKGETRCHKCPKKTKAPAGSSKKKHCEKEVAKLWSLIYQQ